MNAVITEQNAEQSTEQTEASAPLEDAAESFPSSRQRRRLLPALAAVGVLGLAAGLLVGRLGPRPVPPPVVPVYTPRQAAQAQSHLDDLRAQLMHPDAAPPQAVTPGTPSPKPAAPRLMRLQLSQQDLNAYLATNPNTKAFLSRQGVKAVQISFLPPRNLRIRAAVLYRGRPANIQIMGRVEPDRRTILSFTATSAQVGRLPLPPEAVNVQANRLARQFTRRLRGRLPLSVRTLEVVGYHLVLTGVRSGQGSR
ncbi:MAG: LmeA family phospholipid-binding protein, partial [Armatimonadota bacterium]|nr:LmeA family phospholipid-binding protein [Armatimonadota bacterium]